MIAEPLTRKSLNGIWHALILPWTEDDRVDERRFINECNAFANTGVHGLYTGGTTGEFYAQDDAAYEIVTRIVSEIAHSVGMPVQIGVTALSTRTVCQRVAVACRHGADGIQVALPFWMELRLDEALAFLRDVADAAEGVPLILYHTNRAKYKLSPQELALATAQIPTLIGIKDTGCTLTTLREMIAATPDLAIFGGDHDLVERMVAGGRGGYCSVTGLNPQIMVAIYDYMINDCLNEAKVLQNAVDNMMQQYILPLCQTQGLKDSALDRLMRVTGGGDVGLNCQKPYRSVMSSQVELLHHWCRTHAPVLLAQSREEMVSAIERMDVNG